MIKKHWSVDAQSFGDKEDARTVWELEQRINFGDRPAGIVEGDAPKTLGKHRYRRVETQSPFARA
ncbi:MAG: hypothetical protein Q8R25_04870 [bacterium]|nr:hypothetical protein [bacterium]